ncbi:PAP/fibrillin family protein [Prochlorococcus marinus]|uniref:PAP/fibrillin family protein n=1 Tax=Prochlorococcus marinus TaxID=1219 RepID=UPI0022B451E4|nr:PAP/fibrillin family protein [Prochlorococcus marinus]
MNAVSKLIEVLEHTPKSNQIVELIKLAEIESSVDITKQIDLLTGVWELKWSTSNSPFLNYSPLLDNLQILEPEESRGLNLLRPKGFAGNLFSTNILASLEIIDQKRINVSFRKAGIIGPKLLGKKISFLSEIKKTQKGWLDTTVLSPDLRICKGYKGTTFALLKRNDLSLTEFFNP